MLRVRVRHPSNLVSRPHGLPARITSPERFFVDYPVRLGRHHSSRGGACRHVRLTGGAPKSEKGVRAEASRRRTFAVISHPDAGKSTLTEALALHAKVISEAGAVHGKAGRKSTVSDWMEMEKARGISVSSTALQFNYRSTEASADEPSTT